MDKRKMFLSAGSSKGNSLKKGSKVDDSTGVSSLGGMDDSDAFA